MAWYSESTIVILREASEEFELPDLSAKRLKSWQIAPATELDRLGNTLFRLRSRQDTAEWQSASHELAQAYRVLHGTGNSLRNWFSGARIETTWGAIHSAEVLIVAILPPEELLSSIPGQEVAISQNLKGDTRADTYTKALQAIATAATVTGADRATFSRVAEDTRRTSDLAHVNLRSFRNLLYAIGLLVLAATAVAPLLANHNPGYIPICASSSAAQTTTTTSATAASSSTGSSSATSERPCPGDSKNSSVGDVVAIELLGALGGLLSLVLAIRRMQPSQAPYTLLAPQTVLKLSTGAIAALLGVMLMQSGLISLLAAQTGWIVYVYAVLFGLAQDAVTKYADQKASDLVGAAESKNAPAAASSADSSTATSSPS